MRIEKIAQSVKCDIASCGKTAVYTVHGGAGLARNINLCEQCARELYKELSKLFVPKSPQNVVAKAVKDASIRFYEAADKKSGGRK